MTATSAISGTAELSTPGGTARFRRTAMATAMFVAPWGFVFGNAAYAWETRHGGSDSTSSGALALSRAYPQLDRASMVVTMVGALLMVAVAVGAMRLTHRRAGKLGLIGGVMIAAGYIAYFAMLFLDHVSFVMAARGTNQADYAKILDDSMNGASVVWVYLTFVVGNLVGTFLFGLALWRSRAVASWVAWGVLGWPILHVVGLFLGSEWFEVVGALAQTVGFAGVAIYLLRQPLPTEIDPAIVRRRRNPDSNPAPLLR